MRINEIVDNHWSAELSLSESLFCASPEHLSKIGSNRVHFVRQDSWLYVWLNKVDNWLIYFLQNNYLEISLAVFYCISTFLGCVHTPLTLVCAEKIAHECERHKEDMFFSSPRSRALFLYAHVSVSGVWTHPLPLIWNLSWDISLERLFCFSRFGSHSASPAQRCRMQPNSIAISVPGSKRKPIIVRWMFVRHQTVRILEQDRHGHGKTSPMKLNLRIEPGNGLRKPCISYRQNLKSFKFINFTMCRKSWKMIRVFFGGMMPTFSYYFCSIFCLSSRSAHLLACQNQFNSKWLKPSKSTTQTCFLW